MLLSRAEGTIFQKEIITVNIYAPNSGAFKHIKQILVDWLKQEIYSLHSDALLFTEYANGHWSFKAGMSNVEAVTSRD